MSINNFSSQLPQTNWWPRHQIMESLPKTPSSNSIANESINFDLNLKKDIGYVNEIPKVPLFEKPLTPSDVGKLNRLVIPKQYAEKYFPLNAVVTAESGGDSGGSGKGMLLSFEDELGNPWKFRYSYWNSSQSYVLTKGWSRFVKEKKLDAGDVVQFERHRSDNERFFIGWRRKSISGGGELENGAVVVTGGGGCNGGGWTQRLLFSEQQTYPAQLPHGPVLPYPPGCFHAGPGGEGMQRETSGNCKKLRLFGVNMECEAEAEEVQQIVPSDDSGSSACSNPDPAVYQNPYQYHTQLHAHFNQYPNGY